MEYIFLLYEPGNDTIKYAFTDFATAIIKAQTCGLILKRLRFKEDGTCSLIILMEATS